MIKNPFQPTETLWNLLKIISVIILLLVIISAILLYGFSYRGLTNRIVTWGIVSLCVLAVIFLVKKWFER
jgi:uncharacterized membrane protein